MHADVVGDLEAVFGQLFDAGFPIGRMRLVDDYGGDDFASIEAGNTSAFNCRAATGSTQLVAARLRPGHRRQPAGEPLRLGRRHRPSGLRALPRPHAPAGHGHRGRRAGGRLRRRGLGLGRALERAGRLPALLGQRRLRPAARPSAGPALAGRRRHAARRAGLPCRRRRRGGRRGNRNMELELLAWGYGLRRGAAHRRRGRPVVHRHHQGRGLPPLAQRRDRDRHPRSPARSAASCSMPTAAS